MSHTFGFDLLIFKIDKNLFPVLWTKQLQQFEIHCRKFSITVAHVMENSWFDHIPVYDNRWETFLKNHTDTYFRRGHSPMNNLEQLYRQRWWKWKISGKSNCMWKVWSVCYETGKLDQHRHWELYCQVLTWKDILNVI